MGEHTAELLGRTNERRIIFLVMDGLGDIATADHTQTPLEAALTAHWWYPVPALLYASGTVRPDGSRIFGERACRCGGMGRLPMRHLLPNAPAHSRKPAEFEA